MKNTTTGDAVGTENKKNIRIHNISKIKIRIILSTKAKCSIVLRTRSRDKVEEEVGGRR